MKKKDPQYLGTEGHFNSIFTPSMKSYFFYQNRNRVQLHHHTVEVMLAPPNLTIICSMPLIFQK